MPFHQAYIQLQAELLPLQFIGWDCANSFSSLLYIKITKFDTSYFYDQGIF